MYPISMLHIPEAKEKQLTAKKLETTEDLMMFFPRRYLDLRKGQLLQDVHDGDVCAIDGTVEIKNTNGYYPMVLLRDSMGDTIEIVWFGNSTYYFDKFEIGKKYRVAGRISFKRSVYNMSNPIVFFELDGKTNGCIYPIYSKIKGMSESYLKNCILRAISIEESHSVPNHKSVIAADMGLMEYYSAIRTIHAPATEAEYSAAKKRMAYEILYDFYDGMRSKRAKIPIKENLTVTNSSKTEAFIHGLPFDLTPGQKDAVSYVMTEAKNMHRIDTLITGDVGCGKTIVALIAAMLLWENGFQSIIMAPTLVLAKQHFEEMSGRTTMEGGPTFALLTSETKKRERSKILKGLANGSIDILIGTSSVLSDELEFKNLGLTIVDEEHKFGTEQKEILEKKQQSGIHYIAMTATPIPRSLARTIYGESFQVLTIDTLPKGRKPVITRQSTDRAEMFERLAQEVKNGHQAYVICPFIQDSDSERFQDVDSVESVTEEIVGYYKRKYPSIRVDSINGRMKQSAVLKKIGEFERHEFDILVSTTIVEVGVNIPNATAILIMSADRFGLAALHQLRGRVGRGKDQAYCYLSCAEYSEKLEILCNTSNGFKIAEYDLQARGPGNLTGEEQTGYSKAIETVIKRPNLAKAVRNRIFNDG